MCKLRDNKIIADLSAGGAGPGGETAPTHKPTHRKRNTGMGKTKLEAWLGPWHIEPTRLRYWKIYKLFQQSMYQSKYWHNVDKNKALNASENMNS